MSQLKIKNGNNWESIPAGGIGVPSGGTTGQYLKKSSSTDYATEWAEPIKVYQLTGTLPSSTGSEITHAYPTGCTVDNCTIVAFEFLANNIWRNLSYMVQNPQYYSILASTRNDGVHLYLVGSDGVSKPYRCYLLKFS